MRLDSAPRLSRTLTDHDEGWRLLRAVTSYRRLAPSGLVDEPARAARDEIAEWIRANLAPLRAAVELLHGARDAIFVGIEPEDPIVALPLLLQRVNALPEQSPVRETLARRGLDAAACEHVAPLVARQPRPCSLSVAIHTKRTELLCIDGMRIGPSRRGRASAGRTF